MESCANALSRRYAAQMDTDRKRALDEARRARQAEANLAIELRLSEERRKDAARQKRIAGERKRTRMEYPTADSQPGDYLLRLAVTSANGRSTLASLERPVHISLDR